MCIVNKNDKATGLYYSAVPADKLFLSTKVYVQLVVFATRTFTSTEMKMKTIGE